MQLPKNFNPGEYELEIYKKWEEGGFFAPKKGKGKPFCVIMPPPNANGSLHAGHGVGITLEDIMIRYHRMKGEPTVWLPGADHAGFETQVVYQKKLEKEGRNWFTIPREELYKEISDFTLANKSVMENQLRRLGASCDWSREIFTLDERIIKIVLQTFKKLYNDGLIYRGTRIVNWCAKHQTTLSDLEVKYVERQDSLYYIKYGPITLATVRLETKFGDTAVAVNPKDKRYKKFIGQEIEITTLLGPTKIKVIADEAVDMEFGTGAVKVTPAHDPNDFEMWQRHKDEIPEPRPVIDQFGKMELLSRWPNNERAKKYHGLKVMEARKIMAEDMQANGLMEKIDATYKHNVATCYKCSNIVEPRILPQWYVAMTKKPPPQSSPRGKGEGEGRLSLRDAAVKAVKEGDVKFVTKKFEKILFHWLKNIRDWNISRQIVWGIRIPVWYCQRGVIASVVKQSRSSGEIASVPRRDVGVPRNDDNNCPPIITDGVVPKKCPHCGNTELTQETDVFDTWFSSGQWPFATLQVTGDFDKFYPTSVMETGWDILPFWVMRMLALGIYITGKAPFKYVYLHGMVRDKDRQKMSKSKGNVIDPLGVVDLYGADAFRMALVFGVSAGNDMAISEDKIRAHRNFANKIWNASRFVLMNLNGHCEGPRRHVGGPKQSHATTGSPRFARNDMRLTPTDKAILKKLTETTKKVTKYLNKFEFHLAAEEIYQFFWHEFCDKYLEEAKGRLINDIASETKQSHSSTGSPRADSIGPRDDANERQVVQFVLHKVLTDSLKLLHPFMPFVTEAVYQMLPKKEKEFLIIENWPK